MLGGSLAAQPEHETIWVNRMLDHLPSLMESNDYCLYHRFAEVGQGATHPLSRTVLTSFRSLLICLCGAPGSASCGQYRPR
jgi:hypothetical protein